MSETVEITMDLSWRYASGEAMDRFCAGLRERRIEALQCDHCGRRYLPPRPFCGRCRQRMSRWVAVKDEGTLEAWTVVHLPILDGRSGEMREAPYGMGLIRLDGADCTINHYLDRADPSQLRIGARVRAQWRDATADEPSGEEPGTQRDEPSGEEPTAQRGSMDDILYFEVLS